MKYNENNVRLVYVVQASVWTGWFLAAHAHSQLKGL